MKKVIYSGYEIEITLREILVSISIFLLLTSIGYLIYGNIDNKDEVKQYQSAQVIKDDKNKLDYLVKTKFGNVLVYSTFKTSDKNAVTFDEINGKYAFIKKVKERYTMHTRTVCSGSGKSRTCRTETYWTWDYAGSDKKYAENIDFLGYSFDGKKLLDQIPNKDLKLSKDIFKGEYKKINSDYVYESGSVRYYYEYIPLSFKASVFASTRDKELFKNYSLFFENTPEQAIESVESSKDTMKAIFVTIWLFITGVAIYGYISLENKYLV